MFTILSKVVYSEKYGRSVFDRYYQSYQKAEEKMKREAEFYKSNGHWKLVRRLDRMNHEKGFYENEYHFKSTDGKPEATLVLALIDGYFED